MSSINEIQDEIIEEFSVFDDWMDRYQLLIDMGSALPELPAEDKVPENIIEGCQSRVWIAASMEDGRVRFRADSDALIVKGIVALLLRIFDNQMPTDIAGADLYFIEKVGLQDHLSPTRSNGLLSMLKQMRFYAMAFEAGKI